MTIEILALIGIIIAGIIVTKIFIVSVILASILIFWLRRGGFILLLLLFSSVNPALALIISNIFISKLLITGKSLEIVTFLIGNITHRLIIGKRIDRYIQRFLLFLNFYVFKKLIPPPMDNDFWNEITPKQKEFLLQFPWDKIRCFFNNISTRNILYDKNISNLRQNFYIDTHKHDKKFNLKNLFNRNTNNFEEYFYYDEKDDNFIFHLKKSNEIVPNVDENNIKYSDENNIKYSDENNIKYFDENNIKYSDENNIKYSDENNIKYSDENNHRYNIFKRHHKKQIYDKNCKRLCDLNPLLTNGT